MSIIDLTILLIDFLTVLTMIEKILFKFARKWNDR